MKCDRCKGPAPISTGSFFNTDQICFECSAAERRHPSFARAREIEIEHVRRGEFNFPGIGLPDDLRAFYNQTRRGDKN